MANLLAALFHRTTFLLHERATIVVCDALVLAALLEQLLLFIAHELALLFVLLFVRLRLFLLEELHDVIVNDLRFVTHVSRCQHDGFGQVLQQEVMQR